jgi:predicted ester cyclase
VSHRSEIIARYTEYLDACSRHAWEEIPPFVADTVEVNGVEQSHAEYVAGIRSTVEVFPDYRWTLQRALVDGQWLGVHLTTSGTRVGEFLGAPGDGSRVATEEFDMYRIVDGVIHEVHGTADNARLRRVSPPGSPPT